MMMSDHGKRAARSAGVTLYHTLALGAFALIVGIASSDTVASFLNPKPVPFENVQLVSAEREGDTLRIVAAYTKTDASCEIAGMVVYGVSGQPRTPLDYQPIRATGQSAQRDPGYQIMRLAVDTEGVRYARYEIVTQHLCDAGDHYDRVSNVFLQVPG